MIPGMNESLLGYIKRRSDAEGFPEARGFLTTLGQTYGRATVEEPERLALELDLDLATIEQILPGKQPSDAALDWSFHRMHRDPVCPACIAARQPRRKEWRHALVTACAEHECQLIDQCPGCGDDLTLLGDGYAGCLCGSSYVDANAVPASVFEAEFAKLIAGHSAHMGGIDLGSEEGLQTARTVWFLCANMVRARTGKEGKATYPKTVEEARARLARIEPLLLDWPTAFDNHVVQRWYAPDAEGLTAASRLGVWYRGLLSQKGALAEALLSRCLTVAGTVCGDAYKTRRRQDGAEWVSAAHAGEILGIRSERIVEAVRTGAMMGSQGRSGTGHLHTIVRTQDVEAVRKLRARSATKQKVRDTLGVSKKQFELMEEARFFGAECRVSSHPCVDGNFDLKNICTAVDGIRQVARVKSAEADGMLAFRKINLRRTTDRTAILKMYRLIADKKLRAVKFAEGDSLGDVLFDAAEIDRLLQDHGGARSWTAGDVAEFSGWKPECVTGWCEQGLLQATKGKRGSFHVWQITEEALSRFRREFHVVSDLAKEGKTTSRKLLTSLADRGISSVGSQRAGTSSRGHLIRTRDIARMIAFHPS
ncbi:TniQ family protein [Sulfitobacter sp. W027]|uniref:TniQ family protein n=1 Tax=Sulfitobacter sp. W027 TaxID=2867025 RepID=UPI0021A75E60|nr:TniQ family protein [Sulfitobacter sp. W027]UWR33531.1 TniQ family protein [Sulfitobacter sp. W027]